MRILFTTWAWPSHLYAMVPLAWSCRTAGHEVLVASQPALTDVALRTGLPFAPVGRDVDAEAAFREIVATPPGANGGGPRVLKLFAELADAMLDDLVDLARRWRADLLVFEPSAFAGPVAAAAAGVPAVRHLFGTDLLGGRAGQFLPAVLDPLGARYGLTGVDPFGVATVDPYPAGLQLPQVGSRRLPLGQVPFNGAGVVPPPLPEPGARPRVCVTWGTTMGRLGPDHFLAGTVVRALADLDVEVVVAVSPDQRSLLGPVADGVHVVAGSPLHLVLPGCAAVVAHGGAGSLLTAVSYGLPQVLVPRLPDHTRHSARLAETGAGLVVPAKDADPAAVVTALRRVLAEPGFREAADRLRRELAAQPSPAQVVAELERLVVAAPR
ncbi:nucleotide disphospho-sugar-binding domain-containing protein [Micromonospora sp. NPDC047707]|uniref:nucleotide disphospho-sugar-binding domain-containing protein n=1 Tax=Micromonospora sp. NPDC047707 TaxID=3154498 RepID=UPI003452FDD6